MGSEKIKKKTRKRPFKNKMLSVRNEEESKPLKNYVER